MGPPVERAGSQFTCFASTKVQILTPEAQRHMIPTITAPTRAKCCRMLPILEMLCAPRLKRERERERERDFAVLLAMYSAFFEHFELFEVYSIFFVGDKFDLFAFSR